LTKRKHQSVTIVHQIEGCIFDEDDADAVAVDAI
jgi:hypothetical protein